MSEASKIFTKVGLDGKRVAAKSKHKPEDIGGPFIAATTQDSDAAEVSRRMEKVFDAHATLEKLKFETRRLPIARPLGEARRISSGFGIRRDPFRRAFGNARRCRHSEAPSARR